MDGMEITTERVVSTGMMEPSSILIGRSSKTGDTILGYLVESHRKAAGIPILSKDGMLGSEL